MGRRDGGAAVSHPHHALAHMLCASWGGDCACSHDPMQQACLHHAQRADRILQWPAAKRMRLVQCIAGGAGDQVFPALHERLAAAGIQAPVPVAEDGSVAHAPLTPDEIAKGFKTGRLVRPEPCGSDPSEPVTDEPAAVEPVSRRRRKARAEPGPTLNLDAPLPAPDPDAGLIDEEQMRRAAGRAWRA